jgi:glycosyltransferase involved in cell wall biosynthesis
VDRVFGVLVTYRRPSELARALTAIADQTLRVSELFIVDNNGDDPRTRAVVEGFRARGLGIDLIPTESNLGPAGGRAIGMEAALNSADDRDWLALFDDDDALPTPRTLEELVQFAEEQRLADGTLGGVGLRGARFDRSHVRTIAITDAELSQGAVPVDHLHGNFFPVYSASAVRRVGTFRTDFFYGFEELEYGLRMTAAGYSLLVDGALWRECEPLLVGYEQRERPGLGLDAATWERYYSLRNLLRIVIEDKHMMRAARVAFVRGIAKPVVNMPLQPGAALAHLRLGVRAIRDAWSGTLGSIPGADPHDVAARKIA